MGYSPRKSGEAYELLAAATYAIIHNVETMPNQFVKGTSGSRYQIDALADKNVMIEAKDYTLRKQKVSRGDLQKQEGALVDLPDVKEGVFASATGYTKEATKYAEGSTTNTQMKEITPYEIRPSSEKDEEGRIRTINLNFQVVWPMLSPSNTQFVFDTNEMERLRAGIAQGQMQEVRVDSVYDGNGNVTTINDFIRNHNPSFKIDDEKINEFIPYSSYIKIGDDCFKIKGIKYIDVPIGRICETFQIESRGNATLLIRSEKDNVNKLVTDVELKEALSKIYNRG